MKASDLFVRCLEAEGVTRIYGVPGEENADLMMLCIPTIIPSAHKPLAHRLHPLLQTFQGCTMVNQPDL